LRWFHLATELSFQERSYAGLDPLLDRRLEPKVLRASLMAIVSPLGPGTYSRPQFYALYTYSRLDQDAADALFDATDVRHDHTSVHYFGVGAEWWFQSSYR
jgi:maltoporin